MKKIKFYELTMSKEYHVEINLGLLYIMSKIYPESEIEFNAEEKHISALKARNLVGNVTFKKLFYFPNPVLKNILLRDFLGSIYALIGFLQTQKNDVIYFTNVLPFTHWVIYLTNKLFNRECYICLHGQLEAYLPDTTLRFTKYYFRFQLPIYRYDKKNYYIILGEVIYEQIKRIFVANSKCIIIDHPYFFDSNYFNSNKVSLPLKIGQIGVGDLGKGTQYIFELANLLEPYILKSKIEISIVGKLNENIRCLDNNLVKWSATPLSHTDFKNQVEQLHFSLFFRDKKNGSVVASGSFMDAIKYLKPFLAFESPFIKFYKDKFFKSGELFEDVNAMAKYLSSFIDDFENRNIDYLEKVKSLQDLQNSLEINYIVENFKKQLK